MSTNAARITRDYVIIAGFAIIAGFTSMLICKHEREHVDQLTKTDWPQAELHTAAVAALAFKRDHGRLPDTLDELRTSQAGTYLPRALDIKGVMYFRDGEGRPRLSWRDDDGDVAYCSLDAALRERC
ncbi:MAG: hypothetical protein EPN70_00825 [Paraburkholderia sp.]|uniref:hypothetical protein n=1 Tax=Paraburkholderia sp. TaxID=1926495 RepID=UPI00121D7A70|nr:hypothetical protein [Paraburkholderia sp.]TAM08241.1 MAG: hypothetical protein EPN70_00825 [Paraburkholderia sp.]